VTVTRATCGRTDPLCTKWVPYEETIATRTLLNASQRPFGRWDVDGTEARNAPALATLLRGIKEHAAGLAAALRKEPGVEVELREGGRGELTVTVDGQEVASKDDSMPSVEEVIAAVRKAVPAATGH